METKIKQEFLFIYNITCFPPISKSLFIVSLQKIYKSLVFLSKLNNINMFRVNYTKASKGIKKQKTSVFFTKDRNILRFQ